MKNELVKRVIIEAEFIIKNKATVRHTAKVFAVSKSTVHHDVTKKLMQINPALARETAEILQENFAEKHIRGGIATRKKYKNSAVCK